jgi:thiol-disulfide isomerase/thioredoxin
MINKKIAIVLALGIVGTLIVVGVVRFLPVVNKGIGTSPVTTSSSTSSSGPQEISTKEDLTTALNGKKPMVIKFHADWCGACTFVKSYYDELAKELSSVDFYHINIDNQELMKHVDEQKVSKDGIVYLPTFIMKHSDKVHEQMHGAKDKKDMTKKIKETFGL